MNTDLAICCIAGAPVLLLMVRKAVIYRILKKRVLDRSTRARFNISIGLPGKHVWDEPIITPSRYKEMVWDLRKWTYESFYGKY